MILFNIYNSASKIIKSVNMTDLEYATDGFAAYFKLSEASNKEVANLLTLESEPTVYYSLSSPEQGWTSAKCPTSKAQIANVKIYRDCSWGAALARAIKGEGYFVRLQNGKKDQAIFRAKKLDCGCGVTTTDPIHEYACYTSKTPVGVDGTTRELPPAAYGDAIAFLRIRDTGIVGRFTTRELNERDLYALADYSKGLVGYSALPPTPENYIVEGYNTQTSRWEIVSNRLVDLSSSCVNNVLKYTTRLREVVSSVTSQQRFVVSRVEADILNKYTRKLGYNNLILSDGWVSGPVRALCEEAHVAMANVAARIPLGTAELLPPSVPAAPTIEQQPEVKLPTPTPAFTLTEGVEINLPPGRQEMRGVYKHEIKEAMPTMSEALASADAKPIWTMTTSEEPKMPEQALTIDAATLNKPRYGIIFQHGTTKFWLPAVATEYDGEVEFVSLNPFKHNNGIFNNDNVSPDRPVHCQVVDLETNEQVGHSAAFTHYADFWETRVDIDLDEETCVDEAVFCLHVPGWQRSDRHKNINTIPVSCLPGADYSWVKNLAQYTVCGGVPVTFSDRFGIETSIVSAAIPLFDARMALTDEHGNTWHTRVSGQPRGYLTPLQSSLPCVTERALELLGLDPRSPMSIDVYARTLLGTSTKPQEKENTMATAPINSPAVSATTTTPALPENSNVSIFGALANVVSSGVLKGAQAGGALALAASATALATHGARKLGVKQRQLNKPHVKAILSIAPVATATIAAGFIPGIKDNKAIMSGLLMACGAAATKVSQDVVGTVLGTVGQFAELAAGIGQEALPEAEPEVAGKATQVVE